MKTPSFRSLATRYSTLTVALGMLLATHSAQAGNTWDGGGANGLWSNNLNWDFDTLPSSGSANNLTFVGTSQLISQNDLAAGTPFASINFNSGAGAFVLSGNSIALNANVSNNSASIQTVNLGLILTGGNKEASAILGSQLFLGGVVSQDGTARRLQATGQGIVTLNGTAANTYTGQTSASANGTLVIDLSNIAGNTDLVNNTSQLNLGNGNAAATGTLIIKGASSGASSQTLNGLSLATGTSGLVVVNANGGAGTTLNLGASNPNFRNVGSTITFDISSTNAALTGTTLGLAASAQTANQAIRGYALVKDAGGTGFGANVGGALVRYTGGTALLTTGNVTANNATLATNGTTTTLLSSESVNTLNVTTTGGTGTLDLGVGNTLTLGQGAILAQGNSAFTIQNGQLGAANTEVILHAIGTGGVNISSTISSGTGSFTKSGSDAVTLSGNNTYSGNTVVVAGLLKAGSATAFSANSIYNLANSSGVGLSLNGFDVTVGGFIGGGPIGGGIALGANTMSVGGKSTDFESSNIISGTGGVTKVGTAIWQINNANTYTGATTISNGTLKVKNGTSLGIGSALTLGGTGTLDLSGTNLSIGSLSGSGIVTNTNTNTSTLTTGVNNMSTTYSGVIRNGTTPSTMITALTKTGSGELTLAGANTYTGNTTVNGGTLTLDTTGSMTFAIRATGSNNSILGTGALNLNGAFNFDLALAAASGTWNIVNVGTLNEAYGSDFHVNGFTEGTPDVWSFNNGTSIYTFTQSTGILNGSLVPEPSSYLLLGIGVLGLVTRRSRRKF